MITPLLILSGVGLIMASLLAIGRKVFTVDTDARQELLMDILPGANCGGCGYPGCAGYAAALVEGKASPTDCPPGGTELAEQIGKILGVEVEQREPVVAIISCAGDRVNAPERAKYIGVADCVAAHGVSGGSKACAYGCLGLGTCAEACVFDAISTSDNGLCYVVKELCTGCGKCVDVCPRNIIKMVPAKEQVHVLCVNPLKAKEVKAVCSVGCTGCKLCIKQSDRFKMTGALAFVEPTAPGTIPESAALVCGPGAIVDSRHYSVEKWITDSKVRDDYNKRSEEWKAAEKERKAAEKERKATAKAKKEAADVEGGSK